MTEKSGTTYEPWRSRPIFISSTFLDMHAERDWLFQRVFPRLEEELRKRRYHLEPTDLRLGVEIPQAGTEEANELRVLKVCLDEIKRSRPFLLVLLGDRYGWVPPQERMTAAAQEQGFHNDLTGRSVTALEIEFGLLKEDSKQKRRSLFFFRSPLPYVEMSKEVAANYSDEFSPDVHIIDCHGRLEELKKGLRKDPEVGSQVFDYSVEWDKSANKITGLEAFGELVFQKLWAALDEETKTFANQAALTWEEQERASLAEFVEHRNRGFVGRKELITQLLAIVYGDSVKRTEQIEHPIFGACIIGSSGSGKSALFAELYRQLNADNSVLLLANTAGGTIRGSSVDAMLRRWIDELARFLEIPIPVADLTSADAVDSLFHSLLNLASAQRRVVLLLDALDQTEPTPRSQYLTWLQAAPWSSNARVLVTTMPCKAATALGEIPGILQIQLSPLTSIDTDAIVRSVWQRYHREVNSAVLKELTQKSLTSGTPAAGNPLWLTLASEQLNLLDADDFSRAEQQFSGTPVERMQALVLDTARRMPADVSKLYHWLFDQAAKTFGSAQLKAFLAAIALSRHGWRESDLQVLIPQMTAMFEKGSISNAPNLVHHAAMKHYMTQYGPPSNSQEIFPVAELAAMRRAFRSGLIFRNELQWDFFHRETRASARIYLQLNSDEEKALHALISAFLIEQRNDDPIRCDELSFHLLHADELSWLQIYYGSNFTTHPRELESATTMFVDEIVHGGMQRFINISNIDVNLQVVDGDGVFQADIDNMALNKKVTKRDVAIGWCKRCMEYLLPAITFSCSVSDQNDLIKTMLSRLFDASKDFPYDPELQQIIAGLRHNYAALALKMGNWDQAVNEQADALQMFEHLAEGNTSDERHITNFCKGLLGNGDLDLQRGSLDDAQDAYQQARELSMSLQMCENAEFAISCDKLGDLARSRGELAVAHGYYVQALPVFRKLAGMASNSRRDLSLCLSKLGELAIAEKEFQQAHLFLEEHLNIATRIAQSNPENGEYQCDLAGAYDRMIRLAHAKNDISTALRLAEASHGILEVLAFSDKTNAKWLQDLAGSFYNLGNIVNDSGDQERAVMLLTRSAKMLHEIYCEGQLDAQGRLLVLAVAIRYGELVDQELAVDIICDALELSKVVSDDEFLDDICIIALTLVSQSNNDTAERIVRKLLPVEAELAYRRSYNAICLPTEQVDQLHSCPPEISNAVVETESNKSSVVQRIKHTLLWALKRLHFVRGNAENKMAPNKKPEEIMAHNTHIMGIVVSKAGDCFITGGADGCLKIWNMGHRKPLYTISAHKQAVTGLAITQDGSRAFSCSWDRSVKAWNVHTGGLAAMAYYESADLSGIASTSDGAIVYLACEDGVISEWSPNKGSMLKTLGSHKLVAMTIASTSDGLRVVSGSVDRTVKLWDLKSPDSSGTMLGHDQDVIAVAIAQNGRIAVSGSKDKTIVQWDLEKLEILRAFNGHGDLVSALVLSDDGHFLASGSWDKSVRIWRLADGKQVAVFKFASPVWSMAAPRDFSFLLVGEKSGMVTILNLDPQLFASPI